jgi:glycine betaine catabolism B
MAILDLFKDVASYPKALQDLRADRRTGTDKDAAQLRGRQRAFVEAIHPPRMQLRVSEIVEETRSTRTLRLERTDGDLPPFRPGQYVNLFVEIDGVRTSRPYSISSAPNAPFLDLTVREKPDGFVSPWLVHEVAPGALFESTGPIGHFVHEPLIHGSDLVFLAGGSGITPFMGMLRDQQARGWPRSVTLLVGSRKPSDVIFGDEIKGMARGNDRLSLAVVISEPSPSFRGRRGFLDAARIRKEVGEVTGKTFYLCGPNLMLEMCRAALDELGVPRQRICTELFGAPDDVRKAPGWPDAVAADAVFEVTAGDQTFTAPATEPLLNAMERHGVVVPSECRSGECSACRTRLVAGKVFAPGQARVRHSDRRHGFIHPCMSYPVSDLVIRV